jgi:hypothetical protein
MAWGVSQLGRPDVEAVCHSALPALWPINLQEKQTWQINLQIA